MIDNNIFDEMRLPLSSSNEELSIISENYFKQLFDVAKFLIRSEIERDKGIDFQIEIKTSSGFTNFRFAVQLKATDTKKRNKDGSISLRVDTRNIFYLLNNPMPAFYVVYIRQTNTFYFQSINELAKTLIQKNPNWHLQQTHALRLYKILDVNGVEEMYQLALKKGKFQRTINEKIALQSSLVEKSDKILIDPDLNVVDDATIRKLVEGIGFDLINEGKWQEIIHIHKQASGSVAISAEYNLVLGVANYYSSNLLEALSFFRTASKLKTELREDLQNHLRFFESTVKYSIGFLSEDEYNAKITELQDADNIGLYIKLESAKRNYIGSLNNSLEYEKYVSDVQSIIDDPKASDAIKLNAKCELILFQGLKNNMDFVRSVSIINAMEEELGPNLEIRTNSVLRLVQANSDWYKNLKSLLANAIKVKNAFAYFTAIINEVKVSYEFQVFIGSVFVVQKLPGMSSPNMPEQKPILDELLNKITKALNYFNSVGHVADSFVALSVKYELLHYLRDFETASKLLDELEHLADIYDLPEQKRHLEVLKNNGTTHQQFKIWMDKIFGEAETKKREWIVLRDEMTKMDEQEKKNEREPSERKFYINLFPIGHFEFPQNKKEKVYDILNVSMDARVEFDSMFEVVIPVANIHHNPITQEGYQDGIEADKGIENQRNVYRIRKAFYENKFYRFENIPGTM